MGYCYALLALFGLDPTEAFTLTLLAAKSASYTGCVELVEHPAFSFASELPYNTGLAACRADHLQPDRTTVVVGVPRGGTTMVAECLGVLGLPIGVPIPPPLEMFNYEDPELFAVLHRTDPGPIDLAQLRGLVMKRNEMYVRWGFKVPLALNSLPLLETELRSPAFIMVLRDIVATASREHIATAADFAAAVRRAARWQQSLLDFFAATTSPCLLISYEKALQFPDLAAAALAHWAGLEASPEECSRAANHIRPNADKYLRGVRYHCDLFGVPSARTWRIPGPVRA